MLENQLDIEIGKRLTEVISYAVDGKSRQLAIKLGMDPSQLAKIEKGIRGLTVEKAVEISTTYNINLNWLLRGEGAMINKESGPTQEPDYLLTLRKQISTAIVSLQEAIQTLPQPLGPEIGAVGDPAFRQAGKTKRTERQ